MARLMQSNDELIAKVRADLNAGKGYKRRRMFDLITGMAIKAGGMGVVFAVVLIFFYLISVVIPLFDGAELVSESEIVLQQSTANQTLNIAESRYFGTEEYGEVLTNVSASGLIQFFKNDGSFISQTQLPIQHDESIVSVVKVAGKPNWLALITHTGDAFLISQEYQLTYPDGNRVVIPSVEMPLGEEPLSLGEIGLEKLSFFVNDEMLLVSFANQNNLIKIKRYLIEKNFITEALSLEEDAEFETQYENNIAGLMLANDGRWLYVATENGLVSLHTFANDKLLEISTGKIQSDAKITTVSPLLGDYSFMVGDSKGSISQWFGYREKNTNQLKLTNVRSFQLFDNPIRSIIPEQLRKGLLALDNSGHLGVFYTTSEKTLLTQSLGKNIKAITINNSAEKLIFVENGVLKNLQLINEHPEISMSSLWSEVWYESYSEPEYVWQSSASSNDFEPKFSLAPLTYGTLKAAFYALIFAIPLALFGAIYTAYFMSPKLRSVVKPTIEIMEALPTVILGFLAGLWLAPFIELHLTGVILFLILTPFCTLIAGYAFQSLPKQYKAMIPEGWRPILLIPVIALIAYLTTSLSLPAEALLFDGNARVWMRDELGITFDQRNALVVGIAMGFAVIPTIFSIAEDALFSVPKHLVAGSLALGANPWQTMVKVVLPTASPGIFSAVMIGMGRAVGETMIVLMATGNTPVMNMNIFEGMRTLAANIAVEIPEAELASSHYRILFLAALVLFGFTFIANTVAEIIRHRLRKKYSSL